MLLNLLLRRKESCRCASRSYVLKSQSSKRFLKYKKQNLNLNLIGPYLMIQDRANQIAGGPSEEREPFLICFFFLFLT